MGEGGQARIIEQNGIDLPRPGFGPPALTQPESQVESLELEALEGSERQETEGREQRGGQNAEEQRSSTMQPDLRNRAGLAKPGWSRASRRRACGGPRLHAHPPSGLNANRAGSRNRYAQLQHPLSAGA